MYMQSNQPFQQDSVLDGALLGGALGAGAMFGATAAAPKIQAWNKKDTAKNKEAYRTASQNDRGARQKNIETAGTSALETFDKANPNASPSSRQAAMYEGEQSASGTVEASKERTKAHRDLKFNRTVDKYAGKMQGGSSRTRAAMYGGSIIAGALGGAMIDNGN